MFKVLLFVAVGLLSAQASARSLMLDDDKQIQFDTAVCGVVAENYARGELRDRGLTPHDVRSEVYKFSDDIYSVLVKTEVVQDYLLVEGPDLGFSCFRCENLKLVVSKESRQKACANEKL